jgi:ABC-type Fe3+-hydroxamate transport system substrate-binding protein
MKEGVRQMSKRFLLVLLAALLVAVSLSACGGAPAQQTPTKSAASVGSIKINAHPTSLEGKTVVLRWNGKPNGDKFISRIGELLAEKVKGIKVIKLWETDPSTAATSKTTEDSAAVADKIAALKPDLVIALQCD